MKLSPVQETPRPFYPSLLMRQACRLISTAAMSASLLLVGCSATTSHVDEAIDVVSSQEKQAAPNRRLRICTPQPRLSGDMIAPAIPPFTCGQAATSSMPEIRLPFQSIYGRLCGQETAWARVRIPTQTRVRFLLQGPTTRLEILDPSGARVFELTDSQSCLELDMEPGLWIFAARPTNASVGDHGFELWGEQIP